MNREKKIQSIEMEVIDMSDNELVIKSWHLDVGPYKDKNKEFVQRIEDGMLSIVLGKEARDKLDDLVMEAMIEEEV